VVRLLPSRSKLVAHFHFVERLTRSDRPHIQHYWVGMLVGVVVRNLPHNGTFTGKNKLQLSTLLLLLLMLFVTAR
jgi:hypothetical protein